MATGLAAARPARARVNRCRFILSWVLVLGELLITILALDRDFISTVFGLVETHPRQLLQNKNPRGGPGRTFRN
jgi:hypothetical protein